MQPVIAIRDVNHYYGSGALRRQVLYEVSADILPGEIVLITGPSGSGKTTLLTLVGALRSVQEGSICIMGRELLGTDKQALVRVRASIGFIFQAQNLLAALTARQNVQMSLGVDLSVSDSEARLRCESMLKEVGVGHRMDAYPSELSGGQRQRVAIARALVHHPKIILADEPTAALDRKTGREIVELLHQLTKKEGCAVSMVTHDNRVLDIADRVLTLEDGHIISFVEGLMASTGRLLSTFAHLQRKGELRRHVSSMSSKQFLDVLDHMTTEFEQFLRLVDLGNQDAVQALFDEMVEVVIIKIRELLDAERGSVFLVAASGPVQTASAIYQKGEMWSKVAESTGTNWLKIRMPITAGIAGRVARTGETLNIADPYSHPDFNVEVDRKTGYRTQSILCMPIFDRERNIFAVAELLNKRGGQPFTTADEQAFREFAAPLGLILESCFRMMLARAPSQA